MKACFRSHSFFQQKTADSPSFLKESLKKRLGRSFSFFVGHLSDLRLFDLSRISFPTKISDRNRPKRSWLLGGILLLIFLEFAAFLRPSCVQAETRTATQSNTSQDEDDSFSPIVQTEYPAFAKIICHGPVVQDSETEKQMKYYGSGVFVAEQDEFGLVLTNNHVIADALGDLLVRFPTFDSAGVVVLTDEVWDLAAIAIEKPPFLPVPISLEVPQLNETYWMAGYGPFSDLNHFRMVSGPLEMYVIPDDTKLSETLEIKAKVRSGDSGGPILNRYGELAGLIWGTSNEEIMTTGTFCLRLQAFLTQAQFQLKNQTPRFRTSLVQKTSAKEFMRTIHATSTPAHVALQKCGVYPISSQPVYQTDFESLSRFISELDPDLANLSLLLSKRERPPYPAVTSPTYRAQCQTIGREHPEMSRSLNNASSSLVHQPVNSGIIADAPEKNAKGLASNDPATESDSITVPILAPPLLQQASLKNPSEDPNQSSSSQEGQAPIESSIGADLNDPGALFSYSNLPSSSPSAVLSDVKTINASMSQNADLPQENPENEPPAIQNADQNVRPDNTSGFAPPETSTDASQEQDRFTMTLFGIPLTDFHLAILVVIIFLLFFNSLRLLNTAREKREDSSHARP